MIYSINPSKDATIYSTSASMNTGLDEILEISKTMSTQTTMNQARSLLQFDLSEFPLGDSVSGSRKFFLKLYVTEPENLMTNYTLEFAPLTQQWVMGNGKRFNEPYTEEGTSWYYKSGLATLDWWASGSTTRYGGTWDSGSGKIASQDFDYQSADVNADVTSIVEQWIANNISNYGFIGKFTDVEELDFTSYGTLKFFSKDSNTIYKPRLILAYDDSINTYGTGTLNADDTVVYVKGLKPQYTSETIDKIRVIARDRYPMRTFVTAQSAYVSFNYLPTSSYYAVKDLYTGQKIVDFDDDYTKMSADAYGNYFNFNFGTLFPNRVYRFMFKVGRGTLVQYFDSNLVFKVVK